MNTRNSEKAWEENANRLTSQRRTKIEKVISNRTAQIRLVIQDVHNPHNISACLRSAEAFGVQHVDIVHLDKPFKTSSVAKGVSGWLSISHHTSVEDCVKALKKDGYKLVAGMPSPDSSALGDLSVESPLAVIFGNEHEGVHDSWKPHIDHYFTIPMFGMVESLNISVSAAITVQRLTERARQQLGENYFLSSSEQTAILNHWISEHFSLD